MKFISFSSTCKDVRSSTQETISKDFFSPSTKVVRSIMRFLFCWAQAILATRLGAVQFRTAWRPLGLICGALLFLMPLKAQQSQPVSTPQPNCILQAPFTATTVSQVLDNRAVGCLNFILTVDVPSTVSALSLVVQTAQDNGSASCGTCTWTTLTPATGSNPNTLITGWNATFTTALTTYYDFFRINLTAMTGSGLIYAKLYGSINGGGPGGSGGGSGGGGCPGTTVTPCVVVGLGTAGTPAGGVVSVQGVSGATPIPVTSTPSGTQTVAGAKTNNNAAPGATNVGVLPCLANAVAPTWIEGNQVVCSEDLLGDLRVIIPGSTGAAGTPAAGVLSVQGVSGGTPIPVANTPTGTQNVAVIGNAAVLSGQQAVTAAAVALATNASKNACVKALIGNSLNVYVGPTGVTTATGMELAPGDSVCLPVGNTNLLYVVSSATGSSVSWIGTN
jgi:hypothetical protein